MLELLAPAKINLFLEVTGRRPDGYHTLATVFAKLDVSDRLSIRPSSRLSLELRDKRRSGPPLGAGPDNLVLRAAEALKKAFGLRLGARLSLHKRLPVGAGLGGGSSDAAAALRGLGRHWRIPPTPANIKRILEIGRELGADVPFFLQDHPVCEGRGIGDRLRPLRARLPPLVVVYPGAPVSTTQAYRALRLPRRETVLTSLSLLYKLKINLKRGAPLEGWAGCLFNRLEQAVLEMCPAVGAARRALLEAGAEGVLMSGAGSAVFGFAAPAILPRLRRTRPDWDILAARVPTA